jgi:multidrug efflux pump subunit AcrB
MGLIIGLAVFLVFVVLAVQYESMLDPLIILGAVPLGMIGVVAILYITKLPLSAPVLLGVIMLVGILANNSILLVEFAKHFHREQGGTAMAAVVQAGVVRMRPIVMTTIVSVVGALPLALGLEAGGELMRPLAISVVGGLSVSALLTLFVVPGLYVIVHELGDKVKVFVLGSRAADLRTAREVQA